MSRCVVALATPATAVPWNEDAKLTASDAAGYDAFGYSIALSGSTAIVGAVGDDDTGPRSGSAYIRLEYRRAMEIAIVGAAAHVVLGDDFTIEHAAVALTAVAPTIVEVDVSASIGSLVDNALTMGRVLLVERTPQIRAR